MRYEYPSGIRREASKFGCDLPVRADASRFGFDPARIAAVAAATRGTPSVSVSVPTASAPTSGSVSVSVPTASAPVSGRVSVTPSAPASTLSPAIIASRMVVNQLPVRRTAVATTSKPVALKMPINVEPKTALAVADRLLGDPNVKNAPAVIAATSALAQAGDKGAQDAIAVLDAAARIREQTGAQPGQPAVPVIGPGESAAVQALTSDSAYTLSDEDIAALEDVANTPHQSWWDRFLEWLRSL